MRFPGRVLAARRFAHSLRSGGEPQMRIAVALNGERHPVLFMIDTGSPFTILSPNDALALLRRDYFALDFANDSRRIQIFGVGGSDNQLILRDARLTLDSDDLRQMEIEAPVLIAQPVPPAPGDHGNWRLPSLLGRDVLQRFRLELDYGGRPSVYLETR